MTILIIMLVCFFSSVMGSICGIGGGVIIKPALDATGIMEVTKVSFLSGCTVLSMSVVSFYKNLRSKRTYHFDKVFVTILTFGSVIGGVLGKSAFQNIINCLEDKSKVGAIQAIILLIITVGTLIYSLNKESITTKSVTNKFVVFLIGVLLGIMSSFLGIGGGPINLVVLFYLFSMETKEAALYSIYVIMFSQISSLLSGMIGRSVPEFSMRILVLMVCCGVSGGLAGTKINRKIDNKTVDKLFIGLIIIILLINIYNIFRYI